MNNLYFCYSQLYQLSYALPIYRKIGGVFLVRNIKKWIQFVKYTRGIARPGNRVPLLKIPRMKIHDSRQPIPWQGIFLSPSVSSFHAGTRENIITIYTGHGSGDKPYFGPGIPDKMAAFDYHFIAGPKNLAKLKDINVDLPFEKIIKIGNMRFDDYLNQKIDRSQVKKRLGIKDNERQTILYAPTWSWGNGTLLKYGARFCKELSAHYNLIIRPHGHDRMQIPKLRCWAKKEGLSNICFSNPSNLAENDTMDDFLVSDLLISDVSSVMYEYLVTQKPVIIIKNDFKDHHEMPHEMKINSIAEHYDESIPMLTLIERSFRMHAQKKPDYLALRNNCFYFNDGKSAQRAVEFLSKIRMKQV